MIKKTTLNCMVKISIFSFLIIALITISQVTYDRNIENGKARRLVLEKLKNIQFDSSSTIEIVTSSQKQVGESSVSKYLDKISKIFKNLDIEEPRINHPRLIYEIRFNKKYIDNLYLSIWVIYNDANNEDTIFTKYHDQVSGSDFYNDFRSSELSDLIRNILIENSL